MPGQVPENQVFSIDSILDATGQVDESSSLNWILAEGNAGQYVISMTGNGLTSNLANIQALQNDGATVQYQNIAGTYYVQQVTVPLSKWTSTLPSMTPPPPFTTYEEMGNWVTSNSYGSYALTTGSSGGIPTGMLNPGQTIGVTTWANTLMTNGGHLSETKNFGFDSQNKTLGLFNLEHEKVITYSSSEGSHLIGEESYLLDLAGSYLAANQSNIRCVFAQAQNEYLPAFCNVVTAKSTLTNINSAQISSKGSLRMVGKKDIPAELNYQIAVTPDVNSGSGFAEGTVATKFAGSIMEARDTLLNTSAENTWIDETSVTGGIKNFQKAFAYQSGMRL